MHKRIKYIVRNIYGKSILLPIAFYLFTFLSCEKEIDFDYHSVAPVYVIEARVTNEQAEAVITQTRDVTDSVKPHGIAGAEVTLTATDGTATPLLYDTDGYYRTATPFTGNVGQVYTLTVRIGSDTFTASSQMHDSVPLDSIYFLWMNTDFDRFVFLRYRFTDIPGEENYYYVRVCRDGKPFRTSLTTDQGRDGELIQENIIIMSEEDAKENAPDDYDDLLFEGDRIDVEVQTIDRTTYDYLRSVDLSESTSANPIQGFTSPTFALGYFSAYSTVRHQLTFRYAEIAEE